MNIPLEKRLEEHKKIYAQMCMIKSNKRDWYLLNQYNCIRKVKKMIENKEPIYLFDVGGSSTATEGLLVVGGVVIDETSNATSAT